MSKSSDWGSEPSLPLKADAPKQPFNKSDKTRKDRSHSDDESQDLRRKSKSETKKWNDEWLRNKKDK